MTMFPIPPFAPQSYVIKGGEIGKCKVTAGYVKMPKTQTRLWSGCSVAASMDLSRGSSYQKGSTDAREMCQAGRAMPKENVSRVVSKIFLISKGLQALPAALWQRRACRKHDVVRLVRGYRAHP